MQGDGADDRDLTVVFPVLEKGRLLKAMVFNKSVQKLTEMDKADRDMMQAAIGLSKTTSLMLAGGWAHSEMRSDL